MRSDHVHEVPIRVALVNDYAAVLNGLTVKLRPYVDRVIVSSTVFGAATVPSGVADVAVIDTLGASDPTRRVAALADDAAALPVVLTWDFDAARVADAVAAGARGYLSKQLSVSALVEALESVHAGHLVLPAVNGRRVAEDAWTNAPSRSVSALSARETDIVSMIAVGASNEEIAATTYLSINTVKSYIRSAYRKAGVSTRSEAVAWALDGGVTHLTRLHAPAT